MRQIGIEFADVSYRLPATASASSRPAEAGRLLIDRVSLRVAPGTTTALLGRSGSGKTTLLRMVNQLVLPTGGSVELSGLSDGTTAEATQKHPVKQLRASIGYVIQESGLFPHMTVARNAGLALELAGRPKPEIQARVAEVLALVGLADAGIAERLPWQLSGGQRQRVGLARALANDPPVLLMDEPFGALDPITRVEMQTMVHTLLRRLSKTTLLVTHDLDEALYLADRVIFLEAGRIVAELASSEVLHSEIPQVKDYVAAVRRTPQT